MSKYRKKPIVIDATQWNKDGDHEEVIPHATASRGNCEGCGAPFNAIVSGREEWTHGSVKTLEGNHVVCPGDLIITGVQGEHYPCKPDIFAATYEPTGTG